MLGSIWGGENLIHGLVYFSTISSFSFFGSLFFGAYAIFTILFLFVMLQALNFLRTNLLLKLKWRLW